MNGKRLYKSAHDRKITGVCGGIAEYFGIDSTLVRLAMAGMVFFVGAGLGIYIVSAFIIPEPPV